MSSVQLLQDRVGSPIGDIVLVVDGKHLCALDFAGDESRMHKLLKRRYRSYTLVERTDPHRYSTRLRDYLAGDYRALQSIGVHTGGSAFQRMVWAALRKIPVGTTCTYGELARRIGKPTAGRAVGLANSLNPIAIVVPCHRVLGAKGVLTGYAGGVDRKRWLLEHEGVELIH